MANKRQRMKKEKQKKQQQLQREAEAQLDELQNRINKYNARQADLEDVFNSDEFNTMDLHNQMKKQIEQINASKYQREQIEKVQKATINQEKRKAAEDVAKMDALHGEALKENRIRDIVSDAVNNNPNINEAQTYLNRVANKKEITVDELHEAKRFLRDNVDDYYIPETIIEPPKKLNLKRGENTYRGSIDTEGMSSRSFGVRGDKVKINEDYFKPREVRNPALGPAEEVVEDMVRGSDNLGKNHLKKALSGRNLNALVNLGFSIVDYKDARASGDGVLKAGAKAGAQFVAGEMLGFWMMPVALAKSAPTMAVKAFETTQSITRNMNSATRLQTFGEAQFHDTQQLATMRQAGMELAKMSQYNLQQAIMGNEAQYMHKL